ncbi:MAG: 30S ribosomal protein S11 [Pseudomonadota bacterium]
MPPKAETVVVKKKIKKTVTSGNIYVQASFNNTIISFTDSNGGVIAWSSAGSAGFKGSRKGTPFAAQLAAENAGKKAMDVGMRNVNIYISGPGGGRESALRVFNNLGFKIGVIKDITPIPHNGCRPPKRRRV